MTHRFDEITIEQLRAIGGTKWTRFPGDVIGAWVAETDFGTAPAVTAAIHDAIDHASLGYMPAPMGRAMAEACEHWHRDTYGWSVEAEHIHPIADVITGLETAIRHFSQPGSAVILPTPAYMPFFTVPGRLDRDIIEVPMHRDETGKYRMDLDGIAAALDGAGHLIVLCNPHNPTGRVFDRHELAALADVVDAHGGRVFADEIHAPLVYAPAAHVPYASISAVAAGHAITSTSASKAWNLPGLKCAQFIISNEADAEHWTEVGVTVSHGASNLGVVANTAAYRDGRPWLTDLLGYLDGNRHALADLLAEHLPTVRYRPPDGTYLAWLDCAALGLPAPTVDQFREEGVAMTDGGLCGDADFVRLNFATPRPVLAEIVDRMARLVA